MRLVRVEVTQYHIQNGARGVKTSCPVALAILDAMNKTEPHRYSVSVCGDSFSILDNKSSEWFNFLTPMSVSHFVNQFDAYSPVSPFKFEFDLDHASMSNIQRTPYPEFHSKYKFNPYPIQKKYFAGKFVDISAELLKPVGQVIIPIEEVKEPTTSELENFINTYSFEGELEKELVKV